MNHQWTAVTLRKQLQTMNSCNYTWLFWSSKYLTKQRGVTTRRTHWNLDYLYSAERTVPSKVSVIGLNNAHLRWWMSWLEFRMMNPISLRGTYVSWHMSIAYMINLWEHLLILRDGSWKLDDPQHWPNTLLIKRSVYISYYIIWYITSTFQRVPIKP